MRFIENSPVFLADRVTTPLLILHNDQDDAVPWYQGIELFLSLRRLGKEVYLFNYNGEPHGLRKRAQPEGLHPAHAAVLRSLPEGRAQARLDGERHPVPGARAREREVQSGQRPVAAERSSARGPEFRGQAAQLPCVNVHGSCTLSFRVPQPRHWPRFRRQTAGTGTLYITIPADSTSTDVLPSDVFPKLSKMINRPARPNYGHVRGAFRSPFRPQDRSQPETFA